MKNDKNESSLMNNDSKMSELPREYELIKVYYSIFEDTKLLIRDLQIKINAKGKSLIKSLVQLICQFINISFLQTKHIQQIIDITKQIIDQKIQTIITRTKTTFQDYAVIASRNNRILIIKNGYSNDSPQKMVKLDILSHFLLKNKNFREEYHNKNIIVISNKILLKILGLSNEQLSTCNIAFDQMMNWLKYDYHEELDDLIMIVTFTQLMYKISNYRRRNTKYKYIQNQQKNTNVEINSTKKQTKIMKFHFSQVAFLQFNVKKTFERKKIHQKAEIINQLQKIAKLEGEQLQKQELFQLSIKCTTNFVSLLRSFQIMCSQQAQKWRPLMKIHVKLQKILPLCQWIQILRESDFKFEVSALAGCDEVECDLITFNEESSLAGSLYLMAVQRLQLARQFVANLITISSQQSITIFKFDLLLKDFIQTPIKCSKQQQKFSEGCTVLLAASSQPIFSVISNEIFYDDMYLNFLKAYFQRVNKTNCNVLLNDLEEGKSVERWRFSNLISIFKRQFNSRVYLINDQRWFRTQKWFQYLLINYLKNNQQLNRENFLSIVESFIFGIWNKEFILENRGKQSQWQLFSVPQHFQIKETHKIVLLNLANRFVNYCHSPFTIKPQNIQVKGKYITCQVKHNCYLLAPISVQKPFFQRQLMGKKKQTNLKVIFGKNIQTMIEDYERMVKLQNHLLSQKEIKYLQTGKHFQKFFMKRQVCLLDIKRILRHIVRYLLVYQVYFDDIMYKYEKCGEKHQICKKFSKQIKFLQGTIINENKQINHLYPNMFEEILKRHLNAKLFPATKLKLNQEKHQNCQLKIEQQSIKEECHQSSQIEEILQTSTKKQQKQ